MKTKSLNFIIASFFAFVFLISMVSATITIGTAPTLDQNGTSFDIEVTSDQTEDITFNTTTITYNGKSITFSSQTVDFDNETKTITIDYTIESGFEFDFGKEYSTTLEATGTTSDSVTNALSFEETSLCGYDEGSLRVNIEDVSIISGFGDDDEWLPFDEIEVEVEIENKNNDEKIKDIELEWGLWSEETNEWVIELDDLDEYDLKKDDKETMTFDFTLNEKTLDVDLEDLEEGDYTLYVRAKGEEQEDPEFDVCSWSSSSAQIFLEDDFVVLEDIEILPETIECDSNIHITADVWNMGDSDQEDVVVVLYNSELGLSEDITIGDIDAFDSESLDFSFELPSDAEEKTYSLKLTVYDEDHDIYENDYDDSQAIFSVFLKLEESCSVAEASVNAVLESGGKAGQPLVIKATIVNTGDQSTTYMLNAAGYTEWASSVNAGQDTIIVEAGQSQEVLFTFDVKKEALGDNLFTLEVLSENELIVSKPVQVTIEKKGLGITGAAILGDNWQLWGIGILNVILIVFIIIIAIRIARK